MSLAERDQMQRDQFLGAAPVMTIGCRKSDLALIQAHFIITTLNNQLRHPPTFDIRTHTVVGDADKQTPFVLLAQQSGSSDIGKSLWTTGLEEDLVEGKSHFLVHSLKDMPTTLPATCILAAIPEREDPSDAVVMRLGSKFRSIDELPPGCTVGSSSSRRKALVKRHWPHLNVQECRGNVDTRLAKLDAPDSPFACIILATAGLERLSQEARITERLDAERFPHAVGQGALGVEACEKSPALADIIHLLRHVDHIPSRWRGMAERAMLRHLQGGCSSPVGVWSSAKPLIDDNGVRSETKDTPPISKDRITLRLKGTVLHLDGQSSVSAENVAAVDSDKDAEDLGVTVANMLVQKGAQNLLIRY